MLGGKPNASHPSGWEERHIIYKTRTLDSHPIDVEQFSSGLTQAHAGSAVAARCNIDYTFGSGP